MYNRFLIDTSFWINFILEGELHHEETVETIKKSLEEGDRLFTTNDITDETVTRLFYDAGLKYAKGFFELFQQNIKRRSLAQLWVDEDLQAEAFEILSKFKEHKLSLTDATSVAVMKRFNLDAIFSFDSDFKKIGINSLPQT
ncbi:hypothetical protein A3D00_04865 [Candidatus Woesebacteria bacterium RIFCSPHIGHO2_02_FULL_38_9]|uniref:PIN domain-containing protein n=1 Tax=Candidatus Woesebacteria bacterium RIFCSPHIGHO2_01_FULL_39_28 TaxID=1802496 RepID=A0A1F7YBH8_9BACT|nr:MAG: hypothetical protein A2627_03990 [Candidatus Woesebacteria bacterium RIFCSPHIGHO2_01_FULL_39_28]OGM32917.1 MAG: hypothetical protein A3D00_04865 [Candidatus Woesebacteria bacterium RIFCSPHIGHO2_02_FULL_38_9]